MLLSRSVVPHSRPHGLQPCQSPLSFTTSWSLLKLISMELVMPSNHLILCCPLLLLPSTFSSIWVFSSESALHIRWLKYWSFSFSISPANEYSELISFRNDWFDLLAVQGILRWLDSITDSMDMNLSKFQVIVEDRGAWCVAVQGVAELDTTW